MAPSIQSFSWKSTGSNQTAVPHDPWVKIVREGKPGTECLIDTASLEAAYARIYRGESPPLMPSERKVGEPGRN